MRTRPRRLRVVIVGLLAALAPSALLAQLSEVRGTVTDSASRTPVPAAVVMLLDATGATLYRVLTSERGTYRVLRSPDATQLRVVRLGFQPTTVPLAAARPRAEGGYDLDVRMLPFARSLRSVEVSAARGCPSRNDRGSALALLDAARAGLLATVVAREKDPPRLHVLRFERVLDADGLTTVSQVVRVDSSAGAAVSFNAALSADRFLANGFRTGSDGEYTYYGPDADILLSEAFQNGYCFATAPPDARRATQAGLRFTPADRRSGRIDVEGTLWIDTVQRALVEIDFAYVGVDALAEGLGTGGQVHFRALPNGVPFIERWHLRLVGANTGATPASVQSYVVREVGGELAEARWPDGRSWQAPLATVHLSAVSSDGSGVAGATLRLTDSDYRATSDASGRVIIPNVLPGPYRVEIDEPSLRPLQLAIPTTRAIAAQRGSAIVSRVEITGALGLVRQRCNRTEAPTREESWLLGRVLSADGDPLADVKWQVFEADEGRWRARTDVGTSASHGIIALCKGLVRGTTIEVVAWRADGDSVRVRQVLDQPLALVPLRFPRRTQAVRATTAAASDVSATVTLGGVVVDSVSGVPVADARISLRDTPYEGASDEAGRFVIGGIPRGRYTVEVGTPTLDTLGIVWRRDVALQGDGTDVRFFAPRAEDGVARACGANGTGGLLLGRLAPPARGTLAAIAGYRVVAEWDADTSTLVATDSLGQSRLGGFVRATPDPNSGGYRLCGLPLGRAVTVRAEADVMSAGGTRPRTVVVRPALRIARADLQLDTSIVVAPSYSGTVLADSAGTPIERAEVTLRDLGRSTLTDRRGQFRFTDVAPGPHLVSVRAVGFTPTLASVDLAAGRALEQRLLMTRAAQALTAVRVTGAAGVPEEFEERRKLGLGAFVTRAMITAQPGRRLSEVMTSVRGFGNVQGAGGGHAYVVGKRAPAHLLPRGGGADCGIAFTNQVTGKQEVRPCTFDREGLARQGYYCPTAAEQRQGIASCACFAQVYVDDRLMNGGKPTEPFDVNSLPLDEIGGVEFYATAASTPARYSQLDAVCGVMLIWMRRS